jgi:LPS export ABC transporter protein LptC
VEGRALRILAVLLVGAVVLFWAVRPRKTRLAVIEAGVLPPGADARVEGVTVYQAGPKGELTLTANNGEWSRESETFRLDDVDIRFEVIDTSGRPSRSGRITGEHGDANTNGKQFALQGKVVAETFDGYRLETSDVRYDHDRKTVDTDAAVLLNGPGLNVTGKGASVDYEKQRVEIRGRVKAHMVPRVLDEEASKAGVELPKEAP